LLLAKAGLAAENRDTLVEQSSILIEQSRWLIFF